MSPFATGESCHHVAGTVSMSGIGIAVAVVGLPDGSSDVAASVMPQKSSFPIKGATGKSLEIVS